MMELNDWLAIVCNAVHGIDTTRQRSVHAVMAGAGA